MSHKRSNKDLSPELNNNEKIRRMDAQTTAKIDKMIMNIANLTASVDQMKNDLSSILTKFVKQEEEIAQIKLEMNDLKVRLDIRDQKDLADDFKIIGIPYVENCPKDDIYMLLNRIFKVAKTTVGRKDLAFWAMFPNRDKKTATIVSRFTNSSIRSEAFANFRKVTKENPMLWTSVVPDLAADDVNRTLQVRLLPKLTKVTFNLLQAAKEHSPSVFKYVWIRNGGVFIRKAEGQKAINIKSTAELKSAVSAQRQQDEENNAMEN